MKYDPTVTVCSRCHQACCWQGEFMCDFAVEANIVRRKISTLIRNGMTQDGEAVHEHPDWWNHDLQLTGRRLLTRDDLGALGIRDENYLELADG